ncbi:hypothetical protein CMUST_14155 [Corynebacterium mustelae]|uniref:Uncharacterized protein n=1 Tax=Corynebacterium mustelae TaxID=571915 RepID=A0A0G3H175_9CORY|nr:hypothetical protein [Corynebacterium mustelae]AKK07124.1 hypothetical protein CMUST_14155 [Corynebacterium mustelae]
MASVIGDLLVANFALIGVSALALTFLVGHLRAIAPLPGGDGVDLGTTLTVLIALGGVVVWSTKSSKGADTGPLTNRIRAYTIAKIAGLSVICISIGSLLLRQSQAAISLSRQQPMVWDTIASFYSEIYHSVTAGTWFELITLIAIFNVCYFFIDMVPQPVLGVAELQSEIQSARNRLSAHASQLKNPNPPTRKWASLLFPIFELPVTLYLFSASHTETLPTVLVIAWFTALKFVCFALFYDGYQQLSMRSQWSTLSLLTVPGNLIIVFIGLQTIALFDTAQQWGIHPFLTFLIGSTPIFLHVAIMRTAIMWNKQIVKTLRKLPHNAITMAIIVLLTVALCAFVYQPDLPRGYSLLLSISVILFLALAWCYLPDNRVEREILAYHKTTVTSLEKRLQNIMKTTVHNLNTSFDFYPLSNRTVATPPATNGERKDPPALTLTTYSVGTLVVEGTEITVSDPAHRSDSAIKLPAKAGEYDVLVTLAGDEKAPEGMPGQPAYLSILFSEAPITRFGIVDFNTGETTNHTPNKINTTSGIVGFATHPPKNTVAAASLDAHGMIGDTAAYCRVEPGSNYYVWASLDSSGEITGYHIDCAVLNMRSEQAIHLNPETSALVTLPDNIDPHFHRALVQAGWHWDRHSAAPECKKAPETIRWFVKKLWGLTIVNEILGIDSSHHPVTLYSRFQFGPTPEKSEKFVLGTTNSATVLIDDGGRFYLRNVGGSEHSIPGEFYEGLYNLIRNPGATDTANQ